MPVNRFFESDVVQSRADGHRGKHRLAGFQNDQGVGRLGQTRAGTRIEDRALLKDRGIGNVAGRKSMAQVKLIKETVFPLNP